MDLAPQPSFPSTPRCSFFGLEFSSEVGQQQSRKYFGLPGKLVSQNSCCQFLEVRKSRQTESSEANH